MIIIRDNSGNIVGKQASQHYTPTRVLRARHEQALNDAQMGIVRDPQPERTHLDKVNLRRALRGHEPLQNDAGFRACTCEDYPACGH